MGGLKKKRLFQGERLRESEKKEEQPSEFFGVGSQRVFVNDCEIGVAATTAAAATKILAFG